jgi:hypothetical protein
MEKSIRISQSGSLTNWVSEKGAALLTAFMAPESKSDEFDDLETFKLFGLPSLRPCSM